MPNWCSNSLSISGDPADIAKFREWLGDCTALLNKIKPTPKELLDTVAGFHADPDEQKKLEEQERQNLLKFGAQNWYSWNIKHWGTKWDIDAELDEASSTNDCLLFSFESAWSPPTEAMISLGKLFPDLFIKLTYREDGCQFAGILTVDRESVEDLYIDASADKEAYRQWIINEFGDDPFEWENEEDEEDEEDNGDEELNEQSDKI